MIRITEESTLQINRSDKLIIIPIDYYTYGKE